MKIVALTREAADGRDRDLEMARGNPDRKERTSTTGDNAIFAAPHQAISPPK